MSRFANPALTRPFVLGSCQCEGTPHSGGDILELPAEVPAGDVVGLDTDSDAIAQVLPFIRSWNLLEGETAAPIDHEHVGLLSSTDLKAISDEVLRRMDWNTVPNASAARSRSSSRGSGSPIRPLKKAV